MVERGDLEGVTFSLLIRIAGALDIRLDLPPRWRGGDLDRLLAVRHAALAERVATFLARFPAWAAAPEVSFAIYADRGRIDLLAWHPATRSLLVVELKTEITDLQDTLGTLDMKRRHAEEIAKEGLARRERQRLARRLGDQDQPPARCRTPLTVPSSLP